MNKRQYRKQYLKEQYLKAAEVTEQECKGDFFEVFSRYPYVVPEFKNKLLQNKIVSSPYYYGDGTCCLIGCVGLLENKSYEDLDIYTEKMSRFENNSRPCEIYLFALSSGMDDSQISPEGKNTLLSWVGEWEELNNLNSNLSKKGLTKQEICV